MQGFIVDIDAATAANTDFRRVAYTARHMQLVLMSIAPGQSIGLEIHSVDQFFHIAEGEGEAVIDGVSRHIGKDTAIVVPAGARHDIVNTGPSALKLYSIYGPPAHRDGLVQKTREEAEAEEIDEWFDGHVTESAGV